MTSGTESETGVMPPLPDESDRETDPKILDPLPVPVGDFQTLRSEGAERLRLGRNEEAKVMLEMAVQVNPQDAKAQNLLGLAHFRLGSLARAEAIYEGLLRQHPHETSLHVNLGLVFLKRGLGDKAESAFRTALMLEPKHVRAHRYLGFVLYQKGLVQDAELHFAECGDKDAWKKLDQKFHARDTAIGRPSWPTTTSLVDSLSAPSVVPTPLAAGEKSAPAGDRRFETFDLPLPQRPIATLAPSAVTAYPRADGGPTASGMPPMPHVEPIHRVLDHLGWPTGFSTPRELGTHARLLLRGEAYVRRSAIVACVGPLRAEEVVEPSSESMVASLFGGGDDPILRLVGDARVVLRTARAAVAMRDAEDLVIIKSALMGFDAGFGFQALALEELEFVCLSGRGTLLLDCPGAPAVAILQSDTPFAVRRDLLLGYSANLICTAEPEPLGLLSLYGKGLAFFAAHAKDGVGKTGLAQ